MLYQNSFVLLQPFFIIYIYMITFDSGKWVSCSKSVLHFITDQCKAFWGWYTNLYHEARWYKKVIFSCTTFLVLFLLYLGMVGSNFLWMFGKSPRLSSIHNPSQPIASEIYSADSVLIGKFFRENRSPVKYEEISPRLIKTLICTEDERFYNHFGIDIQGVFRLLKIWSGARQEVQALLPNSW